MAVDGRVNSRIFKCAILDCDSAKPKSRIIIFRQLPDFKRTSKILYLIMAIRLIALDLDGTLLNSRGELTTQPPRDRKARQGGVRVALVTGRRFRDPSARPRLASTCPSSRTTARHQPTRARSKPSRRFSCRSRRRTRSCASGARTTPTRWSATTLTARVSCVYDHITMITRARKIHRLVASHPRRRGGGVGAPFPSLKEYLDHAPVQVSFSVTCNWIEHLST